MNNKLFSSGARLYVFWSLIFIAAFFFLFGIASLHENGIINSFTTTLFTCIFLFIFIIIGRMTVKKTPPAAITMEKPDDPISMVWLHFLENSPIAIIMLDKNGVIRESNAAFCGLISKKKGECMGSSLIDIISDENKKSVKELFGNEKTPGNKPLEVKFSDNNEISASLYVNRVIDNRNRDIGYLAYLIDTTEQKNLELRFVHSQKMQAVGQLAGGIAHDFNNLLTAMIGFCDLLLMRHPPGEQSFADIMQIKQNANRASNLVRQLLAFSRQQTLQPEVIDVTDALAELSNLIRRLIGENIELKIRHGRDIWATKVDHGQFEQVIINLAVNARDAMGDGGTLTIKTNNMTIDKNHPMEPDLVSSPQDNELVEGDYVKIEIEDTGYGMTEDITQKIFDPFFTTKKVGEGTGLGLSTVYGIIQQTGGSIYVSSREGKGTKFVIFLKRQVDTKKNSEKEQKIQKELTKDLTGAGTVLLVEDEDPVRIFSSRALQNKGYTVLEANSGEGGLDIIKDKGENIDIIITDVVMPGITGPAMVEKIHETYPDIKVIFISGYAENAFMKTYGDSRKFHFLPKPFTLNQLAEKVKEIIEQK